MVSFVIMEFSFSENFPKIIYVIWVIARNSKNFLHFFSVEYHKQLHDLARLDLIKTSCHAFSIPCGAHKS